MPLASPTTVCHGRSMTRPTPHAGGFFLVFPIVIGFGWGLATGQAMQGAITGLAIGLILAALFWMLDRRRR
jgi:membrane associated rhomboid family serine protease